MVRTVAPWQAALGDDHVLVSGFGKWGGGVYDVTRGRAEALDDLPTSGLAVGGGVVWRVLRAPGEQTGTCELLAYDDRGVRTYQRLDEVRDPHDVCWFDSAVHLSSSWDDAVWRLVAGTPELAWQGGGAPDAWHVNSLTVADGRLHVCAFGRFGRHKAWKRGERRDTGFVHDVVAGRDVLSGLAQPHTPRLAGDRWYVCESARGALTELDTAGTVRRRAPVQRFTRGLALVGRWALVGGNAHRDHDGDRAEVVVVDLDRFEVVQRLAMPCLEIYDIAVVPGALARGVAAGFGTNPARAVEQHRSGGRPHDLHPAPGHVSVRLVTPAVAGRLARMGRPLDPDEARRCEVRAQLGGRVPVGDVRTVRVEVANRSSGPLGSVLPRPVKLGARWFPLDPPAGEPAFTVPVGRAEPAGEAGSAEAEAVANPLVPLPRVLQPGQRAMVEVPLEVPDVPGAYRLRVALRQPGLGWFGVRAEAVVEVCGPRLLPGPPASVAVTGAARAPV